MCTLFAALRIATHRGSDKLEDAVKVNGLWRFTWHDESGSPVKQTEWQKNLITDAGLAYLARLIVFNTTNSIPWYLALGTGTTAAAAGDTTLETEGFRKITSSKSTVAGTAIIRTFLLKSEAINLWTEFGLFMAGTMATDTGTLLSRILPVGGVNKTVNYVLTVETQIALARG